MREAILLYILRSPEERKRLHILMLPKERVPSSLRHAMQGGYSIKKHRSFHLRKQEAGHLIKTNLFLNNIAIRSLVDWWQEFSHFELINLKNIGQFVEEKNPGLPGHSVYAIGIEQFLKLQSVYQTKVKSLLKNIWHKGCISIIKQFKFLIL